MYYEDSFCSHLTQADDDLEDEAISYMPGWWLKTRKSIATSLNHKTTISALDIFLLDSFYMTNKAYGFCWFVEFSRGAVHRI